jgi:DNA polymerase-4
MQAYLKIIHVDMDAFYASVEQRDFPEYRGKPLAVGGSRDRGVVAAASYEARKFGVYSAMPSKIAYRKCPGIIFVKPRFDVYKSVSKQIREIFYDYTDLVEPLSLDEAYLDVTENKKGLKYARDIAFEIKARIRDELKLTASTGVSYNKFLAKIASDYRKPDGYFLIHPVHAIEFIEKLPIEKFHGVGKVTAMKMKNRGILSGADLKKYELQELVQWFGKVGAYYYKIAGGIDERAVEPDRERKSISTENTFNEDLITRKEMDVQLDIIADELYRRMKKYNIYGRTVTLKLKYSDFTSITRSKSVNHIITKFDDLQEIKSEIFDNLELDTQGIRLLGLGISNLEQQKNEGVQLTLDF